MWQMKSEIDLTRRLTALITGGSRGLGYALAKQLAENGHDLILVARDTDRLAKAADQLREKYECQVLTIDMDLATEKAAMDLFDRVQSHGLRPDILVNNAGLGNYGKLLECDPTSLEQMLLLNIVSLSSLIRLFLPGMAERGYGKILNVSSVTAFFSGAPGWSAYVASKQYVLALTRGLSKELGLTGVSVTTVCPGPLLTDFAGQSQVSKVRAYRWLPKVSVATVAKSAYRGMATGRTIVVPGIVNKVLAFLGGLPPRAFSQKVLGYFLK